MKPMTLNEHKRLGAQLTQMTEDLMEIRVKLTEHYGVSKSKKVVGLVGKAADALNAFRSNMEKFLVEDCPELRNGRSELFGVYYPRAKGK